MILITGCPRSGTSMVCGALEACGLRFGKGVCGATPYNRKGQYEHVELRTKHVKNVLEAAGYDPKGVRELPPIDEEFPGADIPVRFPPDTDALKDPKLALIWRAWDRAHPGATWIVVRRDPAQVARSMSQIPWFRRSQIWRLIAYYCARLDDIMRRVQFAVEVDSNAVIRGDLVSLQTAASACGLDWNQKAVDQWLDRSLWHEDKA